MEPTPLPEGLQLVQIIPASESVRLEYKSGPGTEIGPWASGAIIKVSVQSLLPEWGATVEAVQLWGPEGELPPDRLWVKTENTGGTFVPLANPVPVVRGDLRRPVKETQVEIEARPTWQDPPGDYEGTLVLKPTGPELTQTTTKEPTRTTSSRPSGVPGRPQQVSLSFSVAEIIQVAVSGQELRFEGLGPEGTYRAQQDVRFRVLTNARHWRVVCQASNLKGERGEIPAERIRWEQVDERGKVLETGNLGLETTVLHSGSDRMAPDKEITLRFAIDVTMADVAGNYQGSISLQGITGQ